MMTTADQLTAIRNSGFFTALRTEFQSIHAAMVANNFVINGTIITSVQGVPVKGSFTDPDVRVFVGQNDSGEPLYQWVAPAGWLS